MNIKESSSITLVLAIILALAVFNIWKGIHGIDIAFNGCLVNNTLTLYTDIHEGICENVGGITGTSCYSLKTVYMQGLTTLAICIVILIVVCLTLGYMIGKHIKI